jgi:hypothetical protein
MNWLMWYKVEMSFEFFVRKKWIRTLFVNVKKWGWLFWGERGEIFCQTHLFKVSLTQLFSQKNSLILVEE